MNQAQTQRDIRIGIIGGSGVEEALTEPGQQGEQVHPRYAVR